MVKSPHITRFIPWLITITFRIQPRAPRTTSWPFRQTGSLSAASWQPCFTSSSSFFNFCSQSNYPWNHECFGFIWSFLRILIPFKIDVITFNAGLVLIIGVLFPSSMAYGNTNIRSFLRKKSLDWLRPLQIKINLHNYFKRSHVHPVFENAWSMFYNSQFYFILYLKRSLKASSNLIILWQKGLSKGSSQRKWRAGLGKQFSCHCRWWFQFWSPPGLYGISGASRSPSSDSLISFTMTSSCWTSAAPFSLLALLYFSSIQSKINLVRILPFHGKSNFLDRMSQWWCSFSRRPLWFWPGVSGSFGFSWHSLWLWVRRLAWSRLVRSSSRMPTKKLSATTTRAWKRSGLGWLPSDSWPSSSPPLYHLRILHSITIWSDR